MFRRFFARKSEPLSGTPEIRRQKTYSAQSGYVYQYFYEGYRAYSAGTDSGTEFVFTISADRKNWNATSVLVSEAALHQWQREHAREFNATERYAIAKIALFQAFDDRQTPDLMKQEVRVRSVDLDAIVDILGL